MSHSKRKHLPAAALLALAASSPCLAADWKPDAFYVQGGGSQDRATSATVATVWDFDWAHTWWKMEATAQLEAFASVWRAPDFDHGHQRFGQVGVLPVLRLRLRNGDSRFFLDAGIGVSTMDRLYITPTKQFSSKFNFFDVVGLGYSFDGGRQEIGLRYAHISNGGLRHPNPGEDFLLLRYVRRF